MELQGVVSHSTLHVAATISAIDHCGCQDTCNFEGFQITPLSKKKKQFPEITRRGVQQVTRTSVRYRKISKPPQQLVDLPDPTHFFRLESRDLSRAVNQDAGQRGANLKGRGTQAVPSLSGKPRSNSKMRGEPSDQH